MSQKYQDQGGKTLNADLAAFILITSAWVLGAVIFASSPLSQPEAQAPESREVAMVEPTATSLPTNTPLPPTATPTIEPTATFTLAPTATATPLPAPTNTVAAAVEAEESADTSTSSSYDPALVAQGQTLYITCSGCHGPDALGIPNLGKDLVNSEFVHSLSDQDLLTFIKTGRPIWDPLNTTGVDMPPRGGNPMLTDDDLLAIIAYLRSLSAESGAGG